MNNLISRLTKIKLLQTSMITAYSDYKLQKSILKQKERDCKISKEKYLAELVSYFEENPISLKEFLKGLASALYEDNLTYDVGIVTDSAQYDMVHFNEMDMLNYTQYKISKTGNFSWVLEDEKSVKARKLYFFNLLNQRNHKPKLLFKIIKDDKKIIAKFSIPLNLNQKFSDNTNLIDRININYHYTLQNAKAIQLTYEFGDFDNMLFSIPEKYIITREQMGAGIKSEMIIEILEGILNDRLNTQCF